MAVTLPVDVMPAAGAGARAAMRALRADPRLRFVVTPRHAAVLLAVGVFPPALHEPLRRLHDQLPGPRATVWWGGDPDGDLLPDATVVPATDGPGVVVARILALAEDAAGSGRAGGRGTGRHGAGEPDLLPDEPPNPWRGVGPHGQGGEGMMMGTPYGRPMAMTADDLRDGLALDALTVPLGPFLSGFPPGLTLRVTLQGDLVTDVEVESAFTDGSGDGDGDGGSGEGGDGDHGGGDAHDDGGGADRDRVGVPVDPHLLAAGGNGDALGRLLDPVLAVLRMRGLDDVATRLAHAAARVTTDPGATDAGADLRRRCCRLARYLPLRWSLRGVGFVPTELRGDLGGPDARADGWDTAARVRRRLLDAAELLGGAGGEVVATAGGRAADAPAPARRTTSLDVLPRLLVGQDLGDALVTVAGLELDPEAAAAADAGRIAVGGTR